MTFEKWLISVGIGPKSTKNYTGAITGSISKWAKHANIILAPINEITSLSEFRIVKEKIESLEVFQGYNLRGKKMYSSALNHYEKFLDSLTGQSIVDDINAIHQNNDITQTEKNVLISARIGQGLFRKELINYWQGCSITGLSNINFLIASHIKPWKHSNNHERLDFNNGFLLLPNHDKAFDLGYISFSESGSILISSQLEHHESLGIYKNQKIKINENNKFYLKFHRNNIFEHISGIKESP